LKALRNTKRSIELVARPLFILIVAVAFRAVLYASSRIPSSDPLYPYVWASAEWLRRIDLALTVLVSLFVSAMWVMYELGKRKEKCALEKLSEWREKQRSTKEVAPEQGDA
jgi:hypothetical protein